MTAVQFLLINMQPFKNRTQEEISQIITLIEIANKMEIEQIKEAYNTGYNDYANFNYKATCAEDYYLLVYGSDKNPIT